MKMSRFGLAVELRDAFDEVRPVGKIEIIDATRQTGADRAIRIACVILKRAGGVDHDVGGGSTQLAFKIAIAIEGERNE